MPELPEVETVRRGIERFVVGRRVNRVEVGRERSVRRTSAQQLIDGLTDTTILAADRHGKYLLMPLDTGDSVMVHLRMSGQLLIAEQDAPRPKHTHVVAHLDANASHDAQELWFVDPRTFGEVVVFDPENVEIEIPDLANLGVDPLSGDLSLPVLRKLLRARHRQLKPLLLDQHVIAGIGNIYADEILHESRLRPDRMSDQIGAPAERRLHAAIHRILNDAVAAGGSTLGDAQYVDLYGDWGTYQEAHKVYGRTGERCVTCGKGWIRRTVSAQRSTHFCPRCQR